MNGSVNQDILILVKTYPSPSEKYTEVVCTAGITPSGEWVRLYPINYRSLEDSQQYEIFRWVNADIVKNTKDYRPESYRVLSDTIKLGKKLDPEKEIDSRISFVRMVCKKSMEDVQEDYEANRKTLAAFQPKTIFEILIKKESLDWSLSDQVKLQQSSLFEKKPLSRLEKIPYSFRIRYSCDDSRCKGHCQLITEWEIYQTFRSYRKRYSTEKEALDRLVEKYMERLSSPRYDRFIFVGTVNNHPGTFIIIGQYSFLRHRIAILGQTSLLDDFE